PPGRDPEGQFNLGLKYYFGEGVSQNYAKAFEWWQKAAEQGRSDAQYNLGVMYKNGEGVPKNINKAKEWYSKAAEQGYEDAKEALKELK
ncbi:MAG: sel1 repeat family protein, partial [Bacteroidales bacterium]|nr:sel1 repeat family protein [Bacteroidales bacterium]